MKIATNTFKKALLLSALLAIIGPAKTYADLGKEGKKYQNTTDFVCGFTNPDDETVTRQDIYISFHNPHEFPVMLNNFLNFTEPKGAAKPEFAERYLNVLISPNRGFALDCSDISDLFYPDIVEGASPPRSFSAYMHSKSLRNLEINIEYRSQSRIKSEMLALIEEGFLGRDDAVVD